jgi:hypothetical protein
MQFSVVAVAFMATFAFAAESTVYKTEEITITSCHATVTNCPARSTVTSTTSYAIITSIPVYSNSSVKPTTSILVPTTISDSFGTVSSKVPVPTSIKDTFGSVSVPGPLLSTITISTCVPTVIYSTVTVTPVSTKPAASYSTGVVSYSRNTTAPVATSTPTGVTFTGAASTVQGSVLIAAFAGVAAFILA